MSDEMKRLWELVEKDVRRIDRERAKTARRPRRELLNKILAAEKRTNDMCNDYMSRYNIVQKIKTVKPMYVTKFSFVERLMIRLGFIKTNKLLKILDDLMEYLYSIQREGSDIGERLGMISDLKTSIKNLR